MSATSTPSGTSAYIDAGGLIKVYVREPNSVDAAYLVTGSPF